MVETISADEYDQHVAELAGDVAGDVRLDWPDGGHDEADVLDAVQDALDAEQWFFQGRYGPAAHGCIIEHGETDVGRYSDVDVALDVEEVPEAVRRSALYCMEADVAEAAKKRLAE